MWFKRKVQKGTGTGTKIGFPTLNFRCGSFGEHFSEGVYSCEVSISGKLYQGKLYFGPRLSTGKTVLEVYVIGFSRKIYGQFVDFKIKQKIRKPKIFSNLKNLKEQIKKDIE